MQHEWQIARKTNYIYAVTFFGGYREDFKKMLWSRSRRVTYRACFKTYPFVLFKATIRPMSGRNYKFTRNFYVPCRAQNLCLETVVEVAENGAYIMFTSSVYGCYGFTFTLMQNHNGVERQC